MDQTSLSIFLYQFFKPFNEEQKHCGYAVALKLDGPLAGALADCLYVDDDGYVKLSYKDRTYSELSINDNLEASLTLLMTA